MTHYPHLHGRVHHLRRVVTMLVAVVLGLSAAPAPAALAAATVFVRTDGSDTLCNGTADAPATSAPACGFATIQKGVTDVDTGGTVNVRAGTYNELVQIDKTITLRGAQAGADARTRPGTPASESIIANSAYVTANNVVIDGFTIQGGDNVGGDFGTGLYLLATSSGYQILNNIIQNNTFGLYLNSGGATQTLVRHNLFRNNNLPGPASGDAIYSDQGLVNAWIDANSFVGNPDAAIDFSRTNPPAQSNITIINNTIVGGTRPFILLNTTGASIANNTIANAASSATTSYAAFRIYGGVNGLSIIRNTILNGAGQAMLISDNLSPPQANANIVVHFNRIVGNALGGIVIVNGYSGTLDAENNWWGCNSGPGVAGCDMISGSVDANPWLVLRIAAAPNTLFVGGISLLTADLIVNSNGVDTSASGHIPDGTPVTFGGTLGGVAPTSAATTNGRAQAIYTAGATPGSGSATAKVDNPTVSTTITINPKINSTIALSSSANPSVFGQMVTFTATVSPVSPGTGIPSGTLTLKEGGTILGTSALNGSGQATFGIATLGVGAHTITAFYGGNGAFNPSDTTAAPFTQTVNKANTTTIAVDAPDPSFVGQAVLVEYTVTASAPGAGDPSGIVTVTAGADSCTDTVAAGSCAITLHTVGDIALTTTYAGDGNFNGSSAIVSHSVVYYTIYLPIAVR